MIFSITHEQSNRKNKKTKKSQGISFLKTYINMKA